MLARPQTRFGCLLCLLVAWPELSGPVRGEATATDKPASSAAEEDAALQTEARELIGSIRMEVVGESQRTPAKVVEKPVLRFGDTPRDNTTGSVWIWEADGRPAAILELYRLTNGKHWIHVGHSLATDLIAADVGPGHPRWAPRTPGIEWNGFAESPAPGARTSVRLRQIKELAQQFSAHEFWDPNNTRYELRLLVQPIHKYNRPDAGLLDGAVFVFSHGTNPEVVMLIEAVEESKSAKYRYALARLGHAELHVSLGDREVWTMPRVESPAPDSAYWAFYK